MKTARVNYLRQQIYNHAATFFTEDAVEVLQSDLVKFLPYSEALATRGKTVVVPIDIPNSTEPKHPWSVDFNDTALTLWNRIDRPGPDASSRRCHASRWRAH